MALEQAWGQALRRTRRARCYCPRLASCWCSRRTRWSRQRRCTPEGPWKWEVGGHKDMGSQANNLIVSWMSSSSLVIFSSLPTTKCSKVVEPCWLVARQIRKSHKPLCLHLQWRIYVWLAKSAKKLRSHGSDEGFFSAESEQRQLVTDWASAGIIDG